MEIKVNKKLYFITIFDEATLSVFNPTNFSIDSEFVIKS